MSKTMQIDIRILPFYEKRLVKLFPNLSDLFMRLGYHDLIEKEPSFYHLVDHLVTVSRSPRTPRHVKQNITPYADRLLQLKHTAREHLLARRLDELDQVLYQMEDAFEELEKAV